MADQTIPEAPLCACGCGLHIMWSERTQGYANYRRGHHFRKVHDSQAPLCACGCGTKVKFRHGATWAKFSYGHQYRTAPKRTGEFRDKEGYVVIYHPMVNNQRGRKVRRARFVMEQAIGRPLKADEQVHHINRIKDDDRIENLLLVTRDEHNAIHSAEVAERNRQRAKRVGHDTKSLF